MALPEFAEAHENVLSEIWIRNETDIVSARQQVREFARQAGYGAVDQALIATAVSEIARNILEFARTGKISFGWDAGGILIIGEDDGPGIEDVVLAMQDGYSTRNSLGMGLPGVKRLMDEFELESHPGQGTRVVMRKWKT